MKNKKGFLWIWIWLPALILGAVGLLGGGLTYWKIKETLTSIPTPIWYLLIFILIISLLPKRK